MGYAVWRQGRRVRPLEKHDAPVRGTRCASAHDFPPAANEEAVGRGGRDATSREVVGGGAEGGGGGLPMRGRHSRGIGGRERVAHRHRRSTRGAVHRLAVDREHIGAGTRRAQAVALGRRGGDGIEGGHETVGGGAQFHAPHDHGVACAVRRQQLQAEGTGMDEGERAREAVQTFGGRCARRRGREQAHHAVGSRRGGLPLVGVPRVVEGGRVDGGTVGPSGTAARGGGLRSGERSGRGGGLCRRAGGVFGRSGDCGDGVGGGRRAEGGEEEERGDHGGKRGVKRWGHGDLCGRTAESATNIGNFREHAARRPQKTSASTAEAARRTESGGRRTAPPAAAQR